MNLWAGVITEKVEESKAFYVRMFGCDVIYDSDWFVLIKLGDSQLGFMLPNLDNQATIFRPVFRGQGMWIAIDVDDVEAEYKRITEMGVSVEVKLRDEPWGDRHFALLDPNGIGVDVVQRLADVRNSG